MENKKFTLDEIIRDLGSLGEYFKEESGGCVPACIPEAIEILKAVKTLKEA